MPSGAPEASRSKTMLKAMEMRWPSRVQVARAIARLAGRHCFREDLIRDARARIPE